MLLLAYSPDVSFLLILTLCTVDKVSFTKFKDMLK